MNNVCLPSIFIPQAGLHIVAPLAQVGAEVFLEVGEAAMLVVVEEGHMMNRDLLEGQRNTSQMKDPFMRIDQGSGHHLVE